MHLLLIRATLGKIITAFSWMLIHSLWQGFFLAVIAGAVLMLGKRLGAGRKYNVLLVLFGAFLAACVFTFFKELASGKSPESVMPHSTGEIGNGVSFLFTGDIHNIKRLTAVFVGYFSANSPLIVLIWFVFFLFKSVKMMACMVYNHKVKTVQVSQADKLWADAVKKFSEKLKIKKAVSLLQSGYIKMPVVVGHLKPIILIPIGLMANLPAEQIEAILLHELAHIRRSDYFVNFLQNIAETIFFFNPGLLWISSLLREERENCCDDIALSQTQNKKGFVQALISFKEYELYGSNYATAFPGKKNFLLRRVSRIMGNENKSLGVGEKLFFSAGLLIFFVTIATATVAQFKDIPKNVFKQASLDHQAKTMTVNPVKLTESAKITVAGEIEKSKSKMKVGIHGISGKVKRLAVIIAEHEPLPVPSPQKIENVNITEPVGSVSVHTKVAVALTDQQQAEQDQAAARIAQAQAVLDQAQARKDQEQARRDQEQAKLDQIQALKDQEQARKDQEQAKRDQIQARLEQEQVSKAKENLDSKVKDNNQ